MTEPTHSDRRDLQEARRQGVLLVVVLVATLVLLLGVAALVGRAPAPASPIAAGNTAPTGGPAMTATAAPSGYGPASTAPSDSASPSASASPAVVPVLVGAGDIGDCATRDDDGTSALLDGIAGTIFTAGDNAYESGTAEQFATCYDESWGRHKSRTRPAPGNHDWDSGTLVGYFGYFGAAAQGRDGDSWYSYDLGAWHVIVLDSECARVDGCGPDSPQGRWLAADLAASRSVCTVSIWHKPRFSSGEHGNDPAVAPFWTALHAAGADVVINGHDHDYERFAPQDPDGNEDRIRGMREFVAGTGGIALRPFRQPVANSELRVSVDHGVFKLTLRDRGYDWEFLPITSAVSDRGTASCH